MAWTPDRFARIALAASLLFLGGAAAGSSHGPADNQSARRLTDRSDGRDWAAYGRTFGEQHFSPLSDINDRNVGHLGLVWSMDLDPGNSVTTPLAVDGILYFATGLSIVHAVDAATGRVLWQFDPRVAEANPLKLRGGWGVRGIAWWNGRIYVGTQDGRLIALDAATGKSLWSAMTVQPDDSRYITGAPRVFGNIVVVGHAGADRGLTRGYVTAYDSGTGKQLWRFYTVPGNPADGFEDAAMEAAARTWFGEWWKLGGGGTVWNAITYDEESDTLYIGTGNGGPWNHKVRSEGKGDNLFLCSIVALDARTGRYKWHYQINPGDTWDYNAVMDMQLADLTIAGQPRKVLMTAPKNGFFYVIDRTDGKLISAKPYVKVTWADHIDLATGRPVENPKARYPRGTTFELWPSPLGGHNWQPMAFNPRTRLVYIPATEKSSTFTDDPRIYDGTWKAGGGRMVGQPGAMLDMYGRSDDPRDRTSALIAWDPVTQKEVWRYPTPSTVTGSVMTTAGNLVFQGAIDGSFRAHAADSGKLLWSFAAQAPVLAPPITYTVRGRQYVTVLTGMGLSVGILGDLFTEYHVDYRSQARRVLTFALGGTKTLPPAAPFHLEAVDDPEFARDDARQQRGRPVFGIRCGSCHGINAIAAGSAPDLRASPAILDAGAFARIVHDGILRDGGMPVFDDITDAEREDVRAYLRGRADDLRHGS
jgi:quinohemoprotein ethanol dehydrogenase